MAENVVNDKTTANSYVTNVPGNVDYDVTPLLTVGDEVPLLEGDFGDFTASEDQTFAFTGIPDGTGVFETEDANYVFVNHELSAEAEVDTGTLEAPDVQIQPVTTDISSTIDGQIQGARVSVFQFDKDWNVIGGKNLIETAVDSTGEYALDTTSGNYVNSEGETLPDAGAFSRFCSGYLATYGFEGGPIWFTAEESDETSRGWAVTPDGIAQALDGLGRYSKENVVAPTEYRADNSDQTVLLSTEDFADGELYMFVGQQTEADPNGFTDGDLYTLDVEGADSEGQVSEGPTAAGWTLVPDDVALNPDGTVLSDYVNTEGRSTNFQRLEDIAEDPNNPGTFYFATTGTAEKLGGDVEDNTDDAATPEEAENPYGRLYRFSLNPDDPTGAVSDFELLQEGGPGAGVSYDNIVVDSNGKVLIQEDETAFGGDVMLEENRDARVYSYDIASDEITPILELDENAAGEQFNNVVDPGEPAEEIPGEWETSGVIELDPNAQPGQSSYLLDVQAHTVVNDEDSTEVLNGNHVQGGQLLKAEPSETNNSVIFVHPDGTGVADWNAARFFHEGPDGRLNWDTMSNSATYLGHMKDRLTGTSNAGAVTHANGVKVQADSYGLDEAGNPVVPLSGNEGQTILEEAIAAGKGTAVINSGIIAEPGTGAFLAAVESRSETQEITRQIVESGVNVILGGGEVDYLPEGVEGRYGEGERTDGLNLVERSEELGYTVVYTEEELRNLPAGTEKVLGIFAAEDTYNDDTEQALAAEGLPLYNPAPTVSEMLDAALGVVSQNPKGFAIVAEEEGTDNFSNNNNAAGTLEALKRADDAIGVAQDFIDQNPNTLLVTAADSEAGGLEIIDPVPADEPVGTVTVASDPPTEVPLDGVEGTGTLPFISAPDSTGRTYPFGISWASENDTPGSVVAKAYGLNADQLPETVDNTGIYKLMYETLFDTKLPSGVVRNATNLSNGQNTFELSRGNGTLDFRNFGGVGTGTEPSDAALAEVDTLQFTGDGLTARNLLLNQEGSDLVFGFEGAGDVTARLQDFDLEDLDNLHQSAGASGDVGNILFDGQSTLLDSFDVVNADEEPQQVFNRNTVTFLNDLDNTTSGYNDSDDVINGQGGNDTLTGLSGDDIFRGGAGSDVYTGGTGADQFWLVSGALSEEGETDTITDFLVGTDAIGLSGLSEVTEFSDLGITQNGADTVISAIGQDLATLTGIQASTLNSSSFTFA